MKVVEFDKRWPDSYKASYYYDLIEIYDQVPDNMLGYFYQYKKRRKSVVELIRKYLPSGGTVLDIAAAQGNFSLELAELGYEVTWNDLREELADYVKLKYERGNISYKTGNVFSLNVYNKFDVILIAEIIEHVAHPDEFLKKVSEMVKPNGYIIMSTPNGAYFLNKLPKFTEHNNPSIFESKQFKPNADGHIFLLYPSELQEFCKRAKVKLLELELYNNFITNGHIKTGFLLKIIPSRVIDWLEGKTNKLPLAISRKVHSGMSVVFQKTNE